VAATVRQKRTTTARRSVHQTSFLNAFSQACVRSTFHRPVAETGAETFLLDLVKNFNYEEFEKQDAVNMMAMVGWRTHI